MRKLKIGLDFDDLIGWSHLIKPMLAERLFGIKIDPNRFQRRFVIGSLLTQEQYDEIGRETFSGKYPIEPVPGAPEHIRLLMDEGHSLKIVTSRSHTEKQQTLLPALEFLLSHHLDDLKVIGVGYGKSKAEACRDLDLFADDDAGKLRPLVEIVPHLAHFIWPYDEDEPEVEGVRRVRGWEELYQHIQSVAA